jgi:hypothetical protein
MKVKFLTPVGNILTLEGKQEEVIMDVKMLTWKISCRILDETGHVIQIQDWLKENDKKN